MINKYEKHVVLFMMRSYRNNVVGDRIDAYGDALKYIESEKDFIEKDNVEAECLLDEVLALGFLKLTGKKTDDYMLTLKGIEIINR